MSRPPCPEVTAVILNTNRKADTLECLQSLADNHYPALSVLVLDNASSDGSVEAIREQYPRVQILPLKENKGYTGNNNVGIQAAMQGGAKWILVLNEDTVLSADCVDKMVEAGESDPRVGIVGPIVYHFDEPTVIQSAGAVMDSRWRSQHRGANEEDTDRYHTTQEVDWVTGCSMLVRKEVFETVGYLDETFFIYEEETDLCYRARQAGWRVLYDPRGKVWHKGVQRNYNPGPNVSYYSVRNHLKFLRKHRAPLRVWALTWGRYLLTALSWTVRPRWRGKRDHRDALVAAMIDFLRGKNGRR